MGGLRRSEEGEWARSRGAEPTSQPAVKEREVSDDTVTDEWPVVSFMGLSFSASLMLGPLTLPLRQQHSCAPPTTSLRQQRRADPEPGRRPPRLAVSK